MPETKEKKFELTFGSLIGPILVAMLLGSFAYTFEIQKSNDEAIQKLQDQIISDYKKLDDEINANNVILAKISGLLEAKYGHK
jgi:hypothetical protein